MRVRRRRNSTTTALKQREVAVSEEPRQNQEPLHTSLEHVADLIAVLDLDGNLLYATPSNGRILGTPEALHTTDPFEDVHPDDKEKLKRIIREALVTGLVQRTEYRLLLKDGSIRFVESQASILLDKDKKPSKIVVVARDITERKKDEETLLRYGAIVESSADAIIGNTLDGTIVTWNPAAGRMYGYAAEEVLGRSVSILAPRNRLDEIPHLLERIRKGEAVDHFETVRVRKDKNRIDISMTLSAIKDGTGKVIGASEITRDITQLRQAQEALREIEERYRIVAETATDSIISIDRNSTIMYVNPATEKTFGYAVADMLGKQVTILMPEYLRAVHKSALNNYLTTGTKHTTWQAVELTALHKDGHEFPIEISFGELLKNGEHYFTGIIRDISERKKAEEALLRFAAIVKSSTDAIVGKTPEGIIASWNPAAERIYGYSAEEITGRSVSILAPADRPDELPQLLERIKRGEGIPPFETVRVRKDGKHINVSLTISPIKDFTGKIIGASAIARDITELKQAQEALRRSEQELADFFENAPVALKWTGPDGYILRVNQAELDLLGYTHEEYVGHHIAGFHSDQEVVNEILQRLARHETVDNYEARLRCKDGSIKHVLISSNVLWRTGKFVHTRWFTRDITERKRSEDERAKLVVELQEALASVKTLSGLLPICAWCKKVRDDEGYWNQLETYIQTHSDTQFTHGICPECIKKHHPRYADKDS